MGRKKKFSGEPGATCVHCDTFVRKNTPMLGLVYMWHGKEAAICNECGMKVVKIFETMKQRWG